jgi:PAS domain-containing protein
MRLALAGECVQYESEFSFPGGKRYVRASYTPDLSITGAVRGVVVLVQDLTDLKRAEQAAIENAQRLRAVIEGAPVKMWLNRSDGTAEWYNAQWREYTGQSRGLKGTNFAEAIHPDDWHWYCRVRVAAITAGVPYEGKIRLHRSADDAWCFHHVRVSPLRAPEGMGAIWGWVGVAMELPDPSAP